MRKIVGTVFVSLDGVMQAPGGVNEDPLKMSLSVKPWVNAVPSAYGLNVEPVGRAVVAQFRLFLTKSGPP